MSETASYALTSSYVNGANYTTPTFDQTGSTWTYKGGSVGVFIYNTKTIKNEPQQVIRRNWRFNGDSMSLWLHDIPATPYSAVIGFQPSSLNMGVNYTKCGLVLGDSSSYRLIVHALQYNSTWQIATSKYNSTASYDAGYGTAQNITNGASSTYCPPIFLAITDDGTNLTFAYSVDGGNFWSGSYIVSRTDWLTNNPNQIGLVVDSPMTTPVPAWYVISHYQEGAPLSFVNLR